ncbi:MAG: ComF family protein [Rhodanobacter sp.]|nr:ComF family protein [Rhodanobacter sp.]
MKGTRTIGAIAQRLLRIALPPRCLLCGAAGAHGHDLCAGCAAEMAINTVCCPRCALPLSTPAPLCGDCLNHEPPFVAAWAPWRYAHPLDLLEARFKFHGDLAAGRVLAERLVERARTDAPALPDLIIPVPLHPARLRQRGYNQALELARPLAAALTVPLSHDRMLRGRKTLAQTGLDRQARRRNLRGAFVVPQGVALPAHVVLFDDVMTTGATLREGARTLLRAGAQRVDVWALARAPLR